MEGSAIYTDGWSAYDKLVFPTAVRHRQEEFARGKSHVNGIEFGVLRKEDSQNSMD